MNKSTVFYLLVFTIYSNHLWSQRRGNANEGAIMNSQELKQKKYEDSIQKVKDSFEANFDIKKYFQKEKAIRMSRDSQQLNATLEYIRSIESTADTLTSITIQSSTLVIFPNSIRNFKKLKALTLRRCKSVDLSDLFDKLGTLPELTELNLIFSEKTQLPKNIGVLKKLKRLNLNGNKLYTLPAEMSELISLEEINLHNNIQLDADQAFTILSKIKSLKSVNMSACKIETIGESIGGMSQIHTLDLNVNLISSMPLSIESMENLKHLNLSQNKKLNIAVIFSQLSKIKSLESLAMVDCGIREISGSIGTLKQLKHLNVSNNPLSKISSEIGSLINLEEFLIGNTSGVEKGELKTLPNELSSCKALKILDLRQLGLLEIPSTFSQLSALEHIDLSWNLLSSFPDFLIKLDKLKYLNLSRNRIGIFPTQLGRLGNSLETLIFEANFYGKYSEKINKIPQSITTLTKLRYLSLKDQVFEELPDNFWKSFPQLETLNLNGALLQVLPPEIENLKSLKELNLRANELGFIPPQLANLSQLESLDVASNPTLNEGEKFANLIEVLSSLKQLKKLDISYNDIKKALLTDLKKSLPSTEIIKRELSDSPEYDKPRRKN